MARSAAERRTERGRLGLNIWLVLSGAAAAGADRLGKQACCLIARIVERVMDTVGKWVRIGEGATRLGTALNEGCEVLNKCNVSFAPQKRTTV